MDRVKDYAENELATVAYKLAEAYSGKTRTICHTIERCVLYVCLTVLTILLL